MRRCIKIIAIAFCLLAAVFAAQAWAMGGGGQGGKAMGATMEEVIGAAVMALRKSTLASPPARLHY